MEGRSRRPKRNLSDCEPAAPFKNSVSRSCRGDLIIQEKLLPSRAPFRHRHDSLARCDRPYGHSARRAALHNPIR
ncbi:unnamed protein product, partial [Closterium sp. NIES-53]